MLLCSKHCFRRMCMCRLLSRAWLLRHGFNTAKAGMR